MSASPVTPIAPQSRLQALAATKKATTQKPVRVLIYGLEGVGKSTFGGDAPKPVFISPEGGTDEIPNAVEMPGIKTFTDVKNAIVELIREPHDFQSLVIDSADWLEKLCHAEICANTDKTIITVGGGYGSGYRKAETLHKELIELLTELRNTRKMNIIVTAHYHVKTVKDPEAIQDYDAFEIKCHEYVSALWREWVDAVLFCRFETIVKKDEDRAKGQAFGSGKRLMYSEKRPAFQAKNRYGLPFEMDVSWSTFEAARMAGKGESAESIRNQMNELVPKVADEKTRAVVVESIKKAGDDRIQLYKLLNRLLVITKQ